MQRSHSSSLHLRVNDADHQHVGLSFTASPSSGHPSPGLWPAASPPPPPPNQRSISVATLDVPPASAASAVSASSSAKDFHAIADCYENSKTCKQARFKPEQAVHLIPLVLLVCALVLWLGTHSESPNLDSGSIKTLAIGDEIHQHLALESAELRQASRDAVDALKLKSQPRVALRGMHGV